MSIRSPFRKRVDPYWEVDGPAARREARKRKARGALAFTVAVGAVGFAAFAWSIELGLAALVGIRLTLPIG
jgi:hypothetical protein